MYRCIDVHNNSTMYFYASHLPRLTLYLQLYMIISASSPALYNIQVSSVYFVTDDLLCFVFLKLVEDYKKQVEVQQVSS